MITNFIMLVGFLMGNLMAAPYYIDGFEFDGAWRLSILFPAIIASIRLVCLLFVWTDDTPYILIKNRKYD